MIQTGGLGSIGGGLTGAVGMTGLHEAITLAGEKLGFTEVSRFEQLIYGLLLVVALIFCPKGLAPALHGWWRRKRVA